MKYLRVFFFCILLNSTLISAAWSTDQDESSSTLFTCNQPYALCSAAKCIPDPRNNDFAICNCEVFNGLSIGKEKCEARKPYKDSNQVQHIVSTFSLKNAPMPVMTCPNGTAWTDCVDAPCTVNPTDPNQSICSCPIKTQSEIVTFGGNCQKASCDTNFWSGATIKDNQELRTTLAKIQKVELDSIIKNCSSKTE